MAHQENREFAVPEVFQGNRATSLITIKPVRLGRALHNRKLKPTPLVIYDRVDGGKETASYNLRHQHINFYALSVARTLRNEREKMQTTLHEREYIPEEIPPQ